ncbi:ammonium transporter [Amphiplicatus metriothermophilus]|uniref:Ammonium transporter n=1 Tax=Amphiplicatus metriothermophilus TaxID=1519374 RepID=A0A239PJH4_9PROT|nr:ammonium transporter [Amphiplicatus metriothermophilus]MBB5517730.1 Amt family ammonium transporter [Amphiplicatus metriothermophilus]SNT67936.1 ammonium transporter [Amphiplicatus metriothermophilus]
MIKNNRWAAALAAGAIAAALAAGQAAAQEAAPEIQPASETARFAFNTLLFLVAGMVVMFMAAGFCMLEAGLVRSKNAATICLKNIAIYSVAGIMVWLLGYNLIYGVEEGGLLGRFAVWGADDSNPMEAGYAASSDWYFQMVFVATAASIVSGTLAERIKLWPFLIFVAVLTGIIYPIQASWEWGGGFLDARFGFADFAGSTLVHSTGGWAALAGAIVLGSRTGKYEGGRVNAMPGSNLPLATLGTFILWLGWFGFNGGSQLAFGTIDDAISVAKIFVNTNMAACAGVVTAMALTQFIYKKVDLTVVLNGAIGGLVSITAEPLAPAIWLAVLIGFGGGVIVTVAVPVLDRLKIDDVVGAIPAHLLCGIWGTLVVPLSNKDASFLGQFVGVAMIGAFVFGLSLLVWFALKYSVGVRVKPDHELAGLDQVELGLEAYPEFPRG